MKPLAWAALLGLAVVLVFLLSIRLGSVDLTTGEVLAALRGEGDLNVRRIVVDLRAPRAVLAILVGGGLSLAGRSSRLCYAIHLPSPTSWGSRGELPPGRFSLLQWAWRPHFPGHSPRLPSREP
jgi:ABC-type enterobactin transport system permease subunit